MDMLIILLFLGLTAAWIVALVEVYGLTDATFGTFVESGR